MTEETQFKFTGRHLIRITDLTADEIMGLINTGKRFREISERKIKKVPTLRGKTVVNLFMEPSTRTRTSFEIAGKRLSADVINVSASGSRTEDPVNSEVVMSEDVDESQLGVIQEGSQRDFRF